MMGSMTNILVLIFFLYFAHSSSDSGCIESERRALLEFKTSVIDENNSLSSWTGRDCCSWEGITCHNLTGYIQKLILVRHGFNSSLSPWLFNLTHLEVLDAAFSGLRGPIPNMFDKLTSFTHLDLSANSFDSAVFPDSLCSLTSLTVLQLYDSQLQGSLPSCLGNLTSLTTLDVRFNQLSGEIPGGLGSLTHLITLDLSENHFNSSIPSTLGNLRDLEYLSLADNQLSGELSESVLEGLKSLQDLDVSRNHHLVFKVSPQWIPPFQLLSIAMDSVFVGTEFPKWLQNQTNLEELVMMNTSISGVIPDLFPTTHPNLILIDLSNNFLSGSVPIFDNASLYLLQLSGNQLSGTIPQWLCNLTSLENLSLGNNNLIGMIPSCLGALRSLQILSLGNNQLIGMIPSCLEALRILIILDLGDNSLFGHIPNELGSLRALNYLHLNGNKLSGKLPAWLQNAKSLITLDLGDNKLQGSIPNWIGKEWSYLAYLRLESNNFSGEIPVNLCQLPSLQILNLALNNLVGTIPPCLGNLSKMLSNESGPECGNYSYSEALLNIIKGREIEYTSSLTYAKFISLSSNHLHGQIPVELMDLKGLQSLNLSNNDLTGMIPDAINKLEHLESLDLSMNRLSGTIPQSLANIHGLSYLNLSFNNLVGKIPSGNHFNTLNIDPSIYQGNMGLCGKLLMKSCPGDNSPNKPVSHADADGGDGDEEFESSWLYAGIGPGFAVGFLTVIFILYFKDSCRNAYFDLVDNVCTKVWVTFANKMFEFRSKFN